MFTGNLCKKDKCHQHTNPTWFGELFVFFHMFHDDKWSRWYWWGISWGVGWSGVAVILIKGFDFCHPIKSAASARLSPFILVTAPMTTLIRYDANEHDIAVSYSIRLMPLIQLFSTKLTRYLSWIPSITKCQFSLLLCTSQEKTMTSTVITGLENVVHTH